MRDVIAIETERLKLRRLRVADAPRIARFVGDPDVGRNLAMTPLPYLEVGAEGWIMIVNAQASDRGYAFAVELPGEGLIGVIGAHKRGRDSHEVGYWYGRPYWGQGFATEALEGFLLEAGELGPLSSGHFADNPASGRVLEKNGFVYTGEVEQQFSMARGERSASRRMVHKRGRNGAHAAAAEAVH